MPGRGFGVEATVVRRALDVVAVRQVVRTLLYHLVQSVLLAVVTVVVLTAPGDLPEGVCAPAVLQAALFALPGFVQSYCRVVVFVVVALVVVRLAVAAGLAAAGAAILQAALFAFPGFEQS